MPGGDHLNLIEPPGLTVMRIAGGRYRVTAAHRVVWTWNNEFASLAEAHLQDEVEKLKAGDLVTMTIVDVFETDNQGKLLSYCPTFDNRAVHKTNPATERIRKSSKNVMTVLGKMQNSKTAKGIMSRAKSVASSVNHKIHEAAANYTASPQRRPPNSDVGSSVAEFEDALNAAESAAIGGNGGVGPAPINASGSGSGGSGSETTLQEPEPGKDSDNKLRAHRGGGAAQQHNLQAALPVEETRQASNTRSEAYISDSDDATHDGEV